MRSILHLILLALLAWMPDRVMGKTPASRSPIVLAERAAARFPQPVRVGDLVGRDLLAPSESQPVLSHVTGVVRQDGSTRLVIRIGGLFGLGGRSVAVPIEAVALLGEYVALLDITPEQLGELPDLDRAKVREVAPSETILVGLVKPFH